MEGKIFLCGKNTPPQLPYSKQDDFVFDIQRFAKELYEVESTGITKDDMEGNTAEADAYFKVSSDANGTQNVKYFKDMQAALNYVFTAKASEDENAALTYMSGSQVTATIQLLKDVDNGSAWIIGCKAMINDEGTKYLKETDAAVTPTESPFNITIDLNGKEYIFKNNIGSSNAEGVGAVKAMRTYVKSGTSGSNSLLTIKNGELSVSDQNLVTKFERLATIYTDFTLDNVTINAAGVSNQGTGEKAAIIAQKNGTLTLQNGTTFTGLKDNGKSGANNYFAIVGNTYGDVGTTYGEGFKLNINTDGTVGRIATYNENSTNGAGMAEVSIASGEITELFYSTAKPAKITSSGGSEGTTVSGGTFDSLSTDTYNKITFAENSFFAKVGEKYTVANQAGWYGSSGSWNYITPPAEGASIGSSTASLNGSGNTLTLTHAETATGGIFFNSADSVKFGSNISSFKNFTAEDATAAVTVGGNDYLTKITGGAGDDSLTAGVSGVTLDGGAGADKLNGASLGSNVFGFNSGNDTIQGYIDGDIVSLGSDLEPVIDGDNVSTVEGGGFQIGFSSGHSLTFADLPSGMEFVTVRSGRDNYLYAPDAIARNRSVTLAAGHSAVYSFANKDFTDVDATKVTHAISITGNGDANVITASSVIGGSSLNGGAGNDILIGYGTKKATPATGDVFIYKDKGGKDSIQGFAANDSLSVDTGAIKSGSINRNDNLIFKIDSSNTITFDENITKVALAGSSTADSLTKDGIISLTSAAAGENPAKYTLKLFSEQKGKIDLTDAVYDGVTGIDATNVKNGLVTMVGGTAGGTFTFAANKKADVFQYGGGAVDLNGYVSDSDKIDLNKASLRSFTVDASGGVVLNLGDNASITMDDADFSKKEVLLRSPGNNSYKKYVFAQTGVLYDKASHPTQATVYSGTATNTAVTVNADIKKIITDSGVSGINIQAGEKNNTFIDASAANGSVTLVSNKKNDKFTGSKENDTFVFTGGKDVITNYESGDKITLDGAFADSLGSATITQSKKSVTLKFSSKDKLTIKSDSGNIGNIDIGGTEYAFGKNAIITDIANTNNSKKADLTSKFSGTYKVSGDVKEVDGSAVKDKNFTIQGTNKDETLIAGGASTKKTTLKGGGGADSLVGGASQDTFFYAKSDTGAATITNFDYANDHLKIKSTIKDNGISKTAAGLEFQMTNGGSLTLKTDSKNNAINAGSQILIKANNNLYWFEGTNKLCTATDSESKSAIRSVLRDQENYAIVDLNYSTNLVKKGLASVSETTVFTAATAEGYKIRG